MPVGEAPIGAPEGMPMEAPAGMPMEAPAGMPPEGMPPAGMAPEGMPENAGMSEEEMRADLENRFQEIETQKNKLDADKIQYKNELNILKGEIIKDFFNMLTKIGVNPGNMEEVGEFLQMLEDKDPDFVQLIEFVLGQAQNSNLGLSDAPPEAAPEEGMPPGMPGGMPGMPPEPGPAGPPPEGLENKFGNLQETIMRSM